MTSQEALARASLTPFGVTIIWNPDGNAIGESVDDRSVVQAWRRALTYSFAYSAIFPMQRGRR